MTLHRPSHGRSLPIAAATALAVALAASACDQPAPACTSAHGSFSAVYTRTSGTGPCAQLKGEVLWVGTYNPAGPRFGKPDYTQGSAAILSDSVDKLQQRAAAATLADTSPAHVAYALGAFATSSPGADQFCGVPRMSVAEQSFPALPAVPPDPTVPGDTGQPAQPATDIKYEWSGVRVYVTPSANGTQLSGDLRYTRDGCTATYHVAAVYPSVPCGTADGKPNDGACATTADPDAGRAVGSGINPDFPIVCDPNLLLCVLTKEPPALK